MVGNSVGQRGLALQNGTVMVPNQSVQAHTMASVSQPPVIISSLPESYEMPNIISSRLKRVNSTGDTTKKNKF